ncbi:hypothetical protein HDU98_003589 [Podochytrium sp. JEL0797]|nr:hypothetical protein HDU98_003589 [Podochytrium sp. JEL0797]
MDLPPVGFGTYRLKSKLELIQIVHEALAVGYRLIDTAQVYANESVIGEALATSNVPRSELFIATKHMTSETAVYNSVIESLEKLRLEYLDLVLIHWPGTSKRDVKLANTSNRASAWKALERLHAERKVRRVGVSNYNIAHLTELFSYATIQPYVNQVEMHPLYPQVELRTFCETRGIKVQAYSSLGEGKLVDPMNPEFEFLDGIAGKYSKSRAQVLLKWAVQNEVGVIPKSSSEARLRENFDLLGFEIDEKDMALLNDLTTTGGFPVTKYCWDPNAVA